MEQRRALAPQIKFVTMMVNAEIEVFFTKNLYLFQSNNKMVTLFILVLRVILIIRPNIFR